MCEKRPKRERVCRALSALSALSDLSLSLSLSLSANACYYVSKRDAYVRCICVRVCVLPTDEEFSEVRFKEREECARREERGDSSGERETKKPHKKKGRER